MSAGRGAASPASRRAALAAVCAVLFLTFLDTTVVAVALASVQSDLHAGVSALQWVVNGYALAFASLMLGAGTLADRLGRRRLMLFGLGVFATGSLLGACAPTVGVLIGARVVMGVGAAAAEPGTLSIIRQLYPEPGERARALGIWAAICGLALATGPVLGGVLTGLWSWRLVFIANLVLGSVVIAAAHRLVPESATKTEGPIDWAGIVTISAALCAVTFGLVIGESVGYANVAIDLLFAAALVAILAFFAIERRARAPMLELRWLENAAYSTTLSVGFALFFGVFSIFFFTALYLQSVVGLSAYAAAGEFAPMAATLVGASLVAGRLVARHGARTPIVLGGLIAGVGILTSDAVLVASTPPSGWLYVTLAVTGVGIGLALVPVTTVTLALVPADHSSTAASTTNTCRELGAVFGVSVLGSLVNGHLTVDLASRLHALGVPSVFQAIVISAVEHGEVSADPAAARTYGPIVQRVITAAYSAFRTGLEISLVIAGILVIASVTVAGINLRGGRDTASF